MKNIHLSATDRKDIETGLRKGKTLTEIAKSIDKEYNTIKYEIIKHREKKYPSNFNGNRNLCLYYNDKSCIIKNLCSVNNCNNLCKKCTRHFCNNICPNYVEFICEHLTKKPYCCNGCKKSKNCYNIKMIYSAKCANIEYHNLLTKSRTGNRLTQEEIDYANTEIKRRIKNGQSLDSIVKTDDNIKKCTSSYYNYTNDNVFEFSNIDLPKKVSYKKRKRNNEDTLSKEIKTKVDKLKATRNYACFVIFINKYPNYKITEMDTVIGKKEDKKVLLTLLFRKSNFMIAILMNNKQPSTVNEKISDLKSKLGYELFTLLFKIILTDNGIEFTLIEEIETLENNKQINLFFCETRKSNQKGKIEKNHVELRKILPKGTSFDTLTQKDINLVMSHVNSYPRKILNYKSPYETLINEIGEENTNHILNILNYKKIEPKDVILSPKLIKKAKKKSKKSGKISITKRLKFTFGMIKN